MSSASEDWTWGFVYISIFNSLGIFDGQQGSEPLFYTKRNSPSGAREGVFSLKPVAIRHLENSKVVSKENDGVFVV